jgi:hypothetical protein
MQDEKKGLIRDWTYSALVAFVFSPQDDPFQLAHPTAALHTMTTASLPKNNRAWILNKYAKGPVNDNTFKLQESPLPDMNALPDNHVLVKVLTLAFEPAMRPSISTDKSYQPLIH